LVVFGVLLVCAPPKNIKRLRLSEVYERYFDRYIHSPKRQLFLELKHYEAVRMSRACRTLKLGIMIFVCLLCGELRELYRSCKHRFCASCGASLTYKWGEETLSRLMNISHHHIVMTLPKSYRHLSLKNGNKLHNELFKVGAGVIQSWFSKHHGIRVGIVSVLHTSGSDLKYHPHIHMIVSRGGQDLSSGEYRVLRGSWLCKNEELGRLLKAGYEKRLLSLYEKGQIEIYSKLKDLSSFKRWMKKQKMKHWIVSIQEPLSDIKSIVGYVGRYTKRACMSEYKLLEIGEKIRFRYTDYKRSKRGAKPLESEISLDWVIFLDRLLLHVPSKGYRMVRYYGLYNSHYLKSIPSDLKLGESEKRSIWSGKEVEDAGYEWGEYEELRKSDLRSGREDPLYCKDCGVDRVLYEVWYEKDRILIYDYEDSS